MGAFDDLVPRISIPSPAPKAAIPSKSQGVFSDLVANDSGSFDDLIPESRPLPPVASAPMRIGEELGRKGFDIKAADLLRALEPEGKFVAEVLPIIPGVPAFTAITNAAIQAQKKGSNTGDLITELANNTREIATAAYKGLPFTKAVQEGLEGGWPALRRIKSVTAPIEATPPKELLYNAIKAINPAWKAPTGFLPNLAADIGGGLLTGSPQALKASLTSTLKKIQALEGARAIKADPERLTAVRAKGIFNRMRQQPKQLPAPSEVMPAPIEISGPRDTSVPDQLRAAINFERSTPEAAFQKIQAPRIQSRRQIQKELDDIVSAEADALEDLGGNIKGGQTIKGWKDKTGMEEGYTRTSLPNVLKHPKTGNKPVNRQEWEELARENLRKGQSATDQAAMFEEKSGALEILDRQISKTGPILQEPKVNISKSLKKAAKMEEYKVTHPRLVKESKPVAEAAAEAQKEFNRKMRGVAKKLGLKKKLIPQTKGGVENINFKGRPKTQQSIISKVIRGRRKAETPNYGVMDTKDHVRGTLYLDNWKQAPKAVKELKKAFTGMNFENSYNKDGGLNLFGYRGIQGSTKLENGLNGEIQLATRDSWLVKMKSDPIYGTWRDTTKEELLSGPVEKLKAYSQETRYSRKIWSDYAGSLPSDERAAISSIESGLDSITTSSPKLPSAGTQAPSTSTLRNPAGNLSSSPKSQILPSGSSESRNSNFFKSSIGEPSTKNISDVPGKSNSLNKNKDISILSENEYRDKLTNVGSGAQAKAKDLAMMNKADAEKILAAAKAGVKMDPEYILQAKRILGKEAGQGRFFSGPEWDKMSLAEKRAKVQELLGQAAGEGKKERKFIGTVRKEDKTATEVQAGIFGTYEPITNKETLAAAQARVNASVDEAVGYVRSIKDPTAESNATAIVLIDKFQNEGNFNQAIDLVEDLAEKATKQGQAIQALSMYSRLSPEGVLLYAQKTIDKAKAIRPGAAIGPLTPEVTKILTDLAKKVQAAPGGREKAVATARVLKQVAKLVPPTILQKVSLIQTMAQLLNPKTAIRNVVGNAGFAVLENISDVVAAGYDKALSLVTKQRSKVLPQIGAQASGFARGFKEGAQDVSEGINTAAGATQFELPKGGVFKSRVGQALEKLLGYELRVPDRAAFQAAYEGSLANQMKAAKVTVPTEAMIEKATYDGLYRTFQDENAISTAFSKIKTALNELTGSKQFGIGDAVIKYPKTPGAILARGIDYSPAGFIKTVIELAKPLMGQPFNQKAFVESAARSTVGTGLVGTGILLSKLGLITGRKKDKAGIRDLKREVGLADYQLNTSGLKRFVLSGFDPKEAGLRKGDILATYDWFQPQSIDLAIGANINENQGKASGTVGTIADAISAGSSTLAEQPLVSGLKRFFGYGDIVGGVEETLKGVPSSFTPSLVNQVRLLVDDVRRNPDNENPVQESINLVKMRIPGLSSQVPARTEPLGGTSRIFKDKVPAIDKAAQVFLSPANISKFGVDKATPIAMELIRLNVPVTKQGKTMKAQDLLPEERAKVDELTGPLARKVIGLMLKMPAYKKSDDLQKEKLLRKAILTSHSASQKIAAISIARRILSGKKGPENNE